MAKLPSGWGRPLARVACPLVVGVATFPLVPAQTLVPVHVSFNQHFVTYVALDDAIGSRVIPNWEDLRST